VKAFPISSYPAKIAKHLSFDENELFTPAGHLSPQPSTITDAEISYRGGRIDPYVSRVLVLESVEVQRAVVSILPILKSIARS
jgi:hypothetical protein